MEQRTARNHVTMSSGCLCRILYQGAYTVGGETLVWSMYDAEEGCRECAFRKNVTKSGILHTDTHSTACASEWRFCVGINAVEL